MSNRYPLRLSLRGIGLKAAVETQLLAKDEEDTPDYDAFMRFWARFEPEFLAAVDNEVEIRSRQEPWDDCGEDGGEKAARKREKFRFWRNLIIRSASTFVIGVLLMAALKAHGLGGALICLLFGASCFGLALCLD